MDSAKLSDAARWAGARPTEVFLGDNPSLRGVSADSRSVKPGDLFVCMPSASRDTHSFLPQVRDAGAGAAIVHSGSGLLYAQSLGIPAIAIEPTGSRFNFALGRVCRGVLGDPTAGMKVFGVTGTNGKTTTAWMVRHALLALGSKAAYLGTLGFQVAEQMEALNNTTPFPVELWSMLADAKRQGIEHLVMEVSSHALFERRLSGVQFDVGMFTNLSQDHLDFHGTMENYSEAKKLLFTEHAALSEKPFVGALNVADPHAAQWSRELPCRVFTYGAPGAELVTEATDVRASGMTLTAKHEGETVVGQLLVGGLFNIENATSALAGLICLGYPLSDAMRALEKVKAVPGRFEPVHTGRGFDVIVDYAHTPEALELLLKSARGLNPKRIITVFGCGGDRDRSKRPKMAVAAAAHSDLVVLTSDNPRTENPEAILDDVATGFPAGSEIVRITDRPEAVAHAVGLAQPGDLVVIAGKGHENYQIIGRTKHPMDDRDLVLRGLGVHA